MKARISIYAMVFAVAMVTVLAQETKTNAPAGATTGEAAVPAAGITTSTVPREAKPVATAPATPASPAPTQPTITTSPKNSANVHKTVPASPPAVTVTSTPTAAVGNEEPPTGEASVPTNAVPGEPETTPAPANATAPSEGTGLGNKGALMIGVAILVVAGVVAAFMLRRYRVAPHGSLITSAMAVSKDNEKDEDKDEDKPAEKPVEQPVEKKEEKKFPPPMT